MKKCHMKKILVHFIAIPCLMFGILVACAPSKEPKPTPFSLYVAVVGDNSVSGDTNGIPKMTLEQVEAIIEKFKKKNGLSIKWHAGILALGVVDESAYEPLIKMRISPVIGALNERAKITPENQKAVADFLKKARPLLAGPRSARKSDVYGALDRTALFFKEPTIPKDAQRILIFASDGEHDANKRPKPSPLPKDVQVFTVGMDRRAAKKMFGESVISFESFDSAIEAIDIEQSSEV